MVRFSQTGCLDQNEQRHTTLLHVDEGEAACYLDVREMKVKTVCVQVCYWMTWSTITVIFLFYTDGQLSSDIVMALAVMNVNACNPIVRMTAKCYLTIAQTF